MPLKLTAEEASVTLSALYAFRKGYAESLKSDLGTETRPYYEEKEAAIRSAMEKIRAAYEGSL